MTLEQRNCSLSTKEANIRIISDNNSLNLEFKKKRKFKSCPQVEDIFEGSDSVSSYSSKKAKIKIISYKNNTVRVIIKTKKHKLDYTCHSSDELFSCNELALKMLENSKVEKKWYKSVMEIK